MPSEISLKQNIEEALNKFLHPISLKDAATNLLNTLGYHSKRISSNAFDTEWFNRLRTSNPSQKLCIDDWEDFNIIFQISDEEIQSSMFQKDEIDEELLTSYMFVTVLLKRQNYTRTQLADITRFINKEFNKPIMVIFRHGDVLSLAIINRRRNLVDPSKRVLEKVTLIKNINLERPKRSHLDIISELYLTRLIQDQSVRSFDALQKAWEDILNTEALNRKFYKEIYEWYQWAVAECEFPDENDDMQVIRMITRLLFIWFLKEKDLVPEDIFEIDKVEELLNDFSLDTSDYYQAILQNLFFATLNTPINERKFSTRDSRNHRDASKYRYEDLLSDANGFLEHLKQVPFVNGGLFDSLDPFEATSDDDSRIDCFTDNLNDRRKVLVPAKLFFEDEKCLYDIFSHYKFTVEENTPVEQEVALDPELLGQVFENLLGEYNPETQTTARKATGSYYTPRQIVNYMVDESLIAYFLQKVEPYDDDKKDLEDRLREDLLVYSQQGKIAKPEDHLIHQEEIQPMIEALNDLKIIDPAVGTGAFPMGILNKLVLILRKLDPKNEHWKQRQLTQADNIDDPESRENAKLAIEQVFSEANRYNDYGRKLYLIQNSVYGVDIQPIAITIAKLRFFIALIIEQQTNNNQAENYGIRPLPNLETKFVTANALIGLKEIVNPQFQLILENEEIESIRKEIAVLRGKHFNANTRQTKLKYMKREQACRAQLSETLAAKHAEWREQIQNRIEDQVTQSQLSQERAQELREELQQEYAAHEAILAAGLEEAKRIADWDAYDQNAVAEFFDPEWMFGVKDGFDLVIGNPPYIQLQKNNGKLRKLYENKGFDTFAPTGDIYCLFYEKGHKLLNGTGHLCFITSNTWMRTEYGKRLRDYFVTHTQPVQMLDMGPKVFEATVDTNILLFQNTSSDVPTSFRAVSLGADFDKQTGNISQYLIDNDVSMEIPAIGEPWAILSSAQLNLKRKIDKIGVPLKDWNITINYGIKTGCNEAFIIDDEKRKELIEQDPNSEKIIKPLLRGRDIKRYSAKPSGFYILATGYDLDIPNQYPAIFGHLEDIGGQIESGIIRVKGKGLYDRDDQGENWWNLRACAYYSEFDKEKIVWQEIVGKGTCAIDRNNFYAEATTFILTGKNLTYLLGILNSNFFLYAFKNFYAGGHLGSTGIRFKKKFIERSPIPPITEENQGLVVDIENKVEKILAAKAENPNADTSNLENKIDKLVYALYGLTDEEIKIVEGVYETKVGR